MLYKYRAYGPNGELREGEIESISRGAAMNRLRSEGLLVQSIKPVWRLKLSLDMELGAPKLSLRQMSNFFSLLAMLLQGGLPILQALQVLANTNRPPLSKVLHAMAREVSAGQPLSRAMAAQRSVFPRIALHIVTVSELAGELDQGLTLLANQFDNEDQLRRKFKSAMVYPVVVLVMALGLAAFMTIFIVPSFAGMFTELKAELPWQTQALLAVSNFLTSRGHWLLIGVLGTGLGLRESVRRYESVRMLAARLVLKIPVFGPLIWNRETGRYTRTLGTMVHSGVPVISATQAAAELVENAELATRLSRVPAAIAAGATLGRAIKESGAVPPLFAELLMVGEIIGKTDTTLERVANLADGDVRQTLERLTSILEPVLILLLGGIVMCIVVPLLLPMFDLYRQIK